MMVCSDIVAREKLALRSIRSNQANKSEKVQGMQEKYRPRSSHSVLPIDLIWTNHVGSNVCYSGILATIAIKVLPTDYFIGRFSHFRGHSEALPS